MLLALLIQVRSLYREFVFLADMWANLGLLLGRGVRSFAFLACGARGTSGVFSWFSEE